MKYRKLRELEVSAIGLGCMGMHHAYGAPRNEKEMIKLIHKAIELGITFFDTAEMYQSADQPHGNELLVGKALKPYKDKVKIATKFGLASNENKTLITDSRPETIKKSVEASLKRLGIECIDLYYQHRVDPKTPLEEVANTISRLIQEGKIAHWGMSEANAEQIQTSHAICPLTTVQNRYSIMARNWEETVFPVCETLNIGFVAFSPLANGFLSGAYTKDSQFDKDTDFRSFLPQFQPKNMDAHQELLVLLENFAQEKNATKAQISLAWMLAQRPFIVPIPGTTKISRLIENTNSADIELSKEELSKLNEALSHIEIKGVYLGALIK
ncbi:aldo/keto reductase [Taurinivorans muris]|uniref:Aldo/keto reductase n=1 Tax=Taurinivorans muris TaxID=2787751 RepID=A0ABY5XYD2_9BACT|nr:aldo/keto reductase [Desulfovibrionaceae bacterium LT0009]